MADEKEMLKQLQVTYAQESENVQDMGFSQQVMQKIEMQQRQRRSYWLVVITSAIVATIMVGLWLVSPISIIEYSVFYQSISGLALLVAAGVGLLVLALE